MDFAPWSYFVISNWPGRDSYFLRLEMAVYSVSDMYMSYGWGSPRESFHRQ